MADMSNYPQIPIVRTETILNNLNIDRLNQFFDINIFSDSSDEKDWVPTIKK